FTNHLQYRLGGNGNLTAVLFAARLKLSSYGDTRLVAFSDAHQTNGYSLRLFGNKQIKSQYWNGSTVTDLTGLTTIGAPSGDFVVKFAVITNGATTDLYVGYYDWLTGAKLGSAKLLGDTRKVTGGFCSIRAFSNQDVLGLWLYDASGEAISGSPAVVSNDPAIAGGIAVSTFKRTVP